MAVIEKRSGQPGVRWRIRIRKAPFQTLTRTFNYKADAEAWAKETERSLEIGFYDTSPSRSVLFFISTSFMVR